MKKHGECGTRTYESWRSMMRHHAGVAAEWRTFAGFRAGMGGRPPRKRLTRLDPSKPWGPGNAAWSTVRQIRDATSALHPESVTARCRALGLPYRRTAQRLRAGWGWERAIAQDGPPRRMGRRSRMP
jgi:hypothetical protein